MGVEEDPNGEVEVEEIEEDTMEDAGADREAEAEAEVTAESSINLGTTNTNKDMVVRIVITDLA